MAEVTEALRKQFSVENDDMRDDDDVVGYISQSRQRRRLTLKSYIKTAEALLEEVLNMEREYLLSRNFWEGL